MNGETSVTATSIALGLSLCGPAIAVAMLTFQALGIILADRGDATRRDAYETSRRVRLRRASRSYRLAEPLVDQWAQVLRAEAPRRLSKVAAELNVVLDADGWEAAEWLATRRIEAGFWGLALGLPVGLLAAWQFGPAILPLSVALFGFMALRSAYATLEDRAKEARGLVGRALPSSIELMALMFRAGSNLRETIETLAAQTPETVWTRHLRHWLHDIDRNLPTAQALTLLAGRIGIEDVDALAFAFQQAGALGTPNAQVLSTQARQIRDRRSQAIERAAEQSKVYLVLPGTLSLIACLITMLAPLLISVGAQLSTIFG